MEVLETVAGTLAQIGIELLDIAGVLILLYGCGKSLWMLLRKKPHATLTLTRFMSIALSFLLSGEILRMVLVRELAELAIVAGLVLLHGAISFLIAWEVKREQEHDEGRAVPHETGSDVLL